MLLQSEEDTQFLAKEFSLVIESPLVIFLTGNLGVGKSFFVRSVIQMLGIEETIKSPTYSFLETYQTTIGTVNHFDLYRLNSYEEWFDMGFDEVVSEKSISLIEWPEILKFGNLIPDLELLFTYQSSIRNLEVSSYSPKGKELVTQWIKK